MRKRRIVFTAGALAILCSLIAHPAMSQVLSQAQVEVTVVLAVPGGTETDPRLGPWLEDLKNMFRESSYEQLDQIRLDLSSDQRESRELPGGSVLSIQFLGMEDGKINLNVVISEGKKAALNTNFSIVDGGTILVGGPKLGQGNLVLAIRVTT